VMHVCCQFYNCNRLQIYTDHNILHFRMYNIVITIPGSPQISPISGLAVAQCHDFRITKIIEIVLFQLVCDKMRILAHLMCIDLLAGHWRLHF